MRVAQVMTSDCETDDALADVEETMRRARVRRLPVIDAQGVLVGMVSLADLSREAARQHPLPDREVTETEVNETLAAICTPPAAAAAVTSDATRAITSSVSNQRAESGAASTQRFV